MAASGIGLVEGFVKEGDQIKITYNKRLFNDDGKIVLNNASPPPSENCVFCHGLSDGKVTRKWAKKHHSEWYKEIVKEV